MSVPAPFDGFVEYSKRVSSTCLIAFETNRYSVPATFANHPVSLHVYADRLVIVAETQVIAEHQRLFTRDHNRTSKSVYDWRHYLAVVQRKPGALRNGAPFLELPASFKRLQKQLLKHPGGDRDMVDILALVLQHDEDKVEQAIETALTSGTTSRQHVINWLNRLLLPTARQSQSSGNCSRQKWLISQVRSIQYQMKTARFPAYRDLTGFDFAQSEVSEALVMALHRCEFLDDLHNINPSGHSHWCASHTASL